MDENNDWRNLAVESQSHYFETIGSRMYDEIDKSNLFLLKKKVGFATCGKPSELPNFSNYNTGYKEEELAHIKSICNKIIEKSDHDPIHFACTILILYHEKVVCETPVFRIANESGSIFIDAHARVYQNWDSFMKNNKLPECEYCFPLNGEYNKVQGLKVDFAMSPACNVVSKAADYMDTAGTIASVAAGSVFAVSMFATVAPAAIAVAGVSTVCAGAYSVTRNIGTLYDRNSHEQPIGLDDKEARSAWFSLTTSALGTATGAFVGRAQKMVESGQSLSKLSVFGLHALTATSVVFSGFGFVDTFILCADKYTKGTLTKKDVFDLSCELMFLFNAIASAHATTKLVNNMSAAQAAEAPGVQRKLTKTQKRNLRKRAAKRRAKGLSSLVTEESNKHGSQFSTTLQLLIFEAIRAYAPRVEEVLYTCQSIGHDILSWKSKEIPDVVLMSNLARSLTQLYNNYKDEIADAMEKIIKYCSSFSFIKVWNDIYKWFENSTKEIRSIFCTKIINTEDQMEALISDAEREVTELHVRLDIRSEDESLGNNDGIDESLDDNDFNTETQMLLSTCGIVSSSWSCQDLEDFSDIIDATKYVVVDEFSSRMSNYKKTIEAAKAAAGNSFDLKEYHSKLGITGEVGQYMFNDILEKVAERTIYKIKSKCKEISTNKNKRATPVWEVCTDRKMFHFYGPHGAGDLPISQLLNIVSDVVNIYLKKDDNCSVMQDRDVVMIEVKDKLEINIVVYCGITEDNTASGVIMIVNHQ